MEDMTRLSVQVDSFKYPDGTIALSDIRFKVKKGEFLGILGANGSGKTTLLKIMDGLMKDFKGSLHLDGSDVRKLSPKEIYKKVGLIFQNPDDQLFAATVFEDVAFGPINMGFSEKEVLRRVDFALNCVQMQGCAKKSIHNLSLGQKKRVCLAGLLAMGHEVLFLDEPTASLDPMGVSSIMHLLKDLNSKNNVTMVMTTHSVDLVPLFIDRVIILHKGKIVKEGSPEDVFSDTDTLRAASLRLPQIGHLFEILKKKDGLNFKGLPLTIGEAREELRQFTPAPIAKEHSGRQLVRGYTTGTCAQAATKAACIMLTGREALKTVEVQTPSGKRLSIAVINPLIGKDFAQCAVIKDSGDDPDITHGMKICAEVRFSKKAGITLKGAQGIGKVTKPGLAVKVGEWAINPVPRKMILDEAAKFLPPHQFSKKIFSSTNNWCGGVSNEKPGLEITISAPEGEELAKKTFNPKLGITGGISIIGTTGIVEPKSLDAYKASLSLELDVLKAQGHKKAVFVLGYVGERFCKEKLKLNSDSLIRIGDHIGFMLEECLKKHVEEVLLIGHIGKLIKITNGQFNTHYSLGDKRLESIARYAESCGARQDIIEEILTQETAEACTPILREAGLSGVFNEIAKDVAKKSRQLVHNRVTVNCILLSLEGEVLSRTDH